MLLAEVKFLQEAVHMPPLKAASVTDASKGLWVGGRSMHRRYFVFAHSDFDYFLSTLRVFRLDCHGHESYAIDGCVSCSKALTGGGVVRHQRPKN